MDDPSSLFSVEDDGSLLILNRISKVEDERFDRENSSSELTLTPHSDSSKNGGESGQFKLNTKDKCSLDRDDDDVFQLIADEDASDDDQGSGNVSMLELEQLLEKEHENLDLIRKANETIRTIKSIITTSMPSSSLATVATKQNSKDAAINTCNNVEAEKDKEVEAIAGNEVIFEAEHGVMMNQDEVAVKPYQKMLNRFAFRRRRRPNLRANANNGNPQNVQAFFQDYYRSLDSVSRYIIAASILSFLTAFLLLSWYSAQTHSHDMELFGLKEKRAIANQEAFDRYQLQKENLRESLIHQRYEESRECQSFLQSCHSKRDELLDQVFKMEQDNGKSEKRLEAKVESQRKEIQVLEGELHELQQQNKELRREIGQSFSSSYAKALFSFLNVVQNRPVQIIFATGLTMIVILGLITGVAFSK